MTEVRIRVLQFLYASLTREFLYRVTGAVSKYGLSGAEKQLHGGYDERTCRRLPSPMYSLDAFLERHQLDPELYLGLIFRHWKGSRPPAVNQLMSQGCLLMYRQHDAAIPEQLAKTFVSYHSLYSNSALIRHRKHGEELEQAALSALLDMKLDLPALYRFCMLTVTGHHEQAARYRTAAILEYSPLRKHYDSAWKEFIPACLKQAAQERLDKLGVQ